MYKLLTPDKQNSEIRLVCKLVNKATHEWNMDKLNNWFLPEYRKAIMTIPLSINDTSDRLIWAENGNRKFIVKSAYVLALEKQKHIVMVDCSNGMAQRKIWKTIWH